MRYVNPVDTIFSNLVVSSVQSKTGDHTDPYQLTYRVSNRHDMNTEGLSMQRASEQESAFASGGVKARQ